MNEPTLREELESLAKAWEVLAQDHKATGADAGLIQAAVDLRSLAARCEPEKPGEAVAELVRELWVLRKRVLDDRDFYWNHAEWAAYLAGLADRLANAVPEKREAPPEGIGAVVEEMRAAVGPSAPAADYPLSAGQVRAWLTRLESAAAPAAPDEGETSASVVLAAVRDVLIGVQAELGYSKEQGGWYTAMTLGERRVAQAVTDIDFWLDLWRSRSPAHADSGEGAPVAIGDPVQVFFGQSGRATITSRVAAIGDDFIVAADQRLPLSEEGTTWRRVAPPAPAPSAAGEGEHRAAQRATNAQMRRQMEGMLDRRTPAPPPARGNAPRSDEEGGGQGEGRAEGGSGLLAPASAPERCGARPGLLECDLPAGHDGDHVDHGAGVGWSL